MSNYVKSTNFTAKDSLPTGDTNKVIRGSEFDTEFDAIQTAIGTKSDLAGPTFTGTATFANLTATGTVNLTGATVSNLGTVTTVDINGGTIDGATIGANSASTGNFTTLSINGTAITSTAAELNILDGVTASTAEINLLDGVTATTAELNILDGVTATATELNTLDGITASTAELNLLDGVTATTAELNFVDGVTSNIQTQLDAKGTVSNLSDLSITATASEINTLDGITTSTAELNLLDGVTATTAEINYVDGVTSNIQTQLDAKGTVSNLSDLSITATATEINTLDGITATTAELNILDGKTFLDEDDMVSDSATGIPSQQSVKAYVDAQAGGGTLDALTDTNITTPADGAVLFYDTGTSKWIDNVVSGDITIADTGVAAIGSGVIVDADVNASAAIAVSKTALSAGTGLTLTTNTLSVDAAQTQITSVGTLSGLTVSGAVTINSTDALTLPVGTTAQRPTPAQGMLRYNTTTSGFEGYDGSSWGEIGGAAGQFVYTRTTATATASQTTFSATYTVGYVDVYLNGVKLVVGTDFTATNGTSVVLTTGATVGDNVEIIAYSTFSIANGLLATNNLSDLGNAATAITNLGITSTAAELNILDGVTATTAELNYLDVTTLGSSEASKAVTADSSAKVKFIGTTSVAEMIEKVDIPTSTTGTINFDFLSQAVQLYNTNQTANRTINFRGDGSNTLNSIMAVGESMTAAVLMKQGGTAYYLNAYQIDGVSVTPEWQGGSAPSSGNSNSIDAYVFTIIKTAASTYTVLASQGQYA